MVEPSFHAPEQGVPTDPSSPQPYSFHIVMFVEIALLQYGHADELYDALARQTHKQGGLSLQVPPMSRPNRLSASSFFFTMPRVLEFFDTVNDLNKAPAQSFNALFVFSMGIGTSRANMLNVEGTYMDQPRFLLNVAVQQEIPCGGPIDLPCYCYTDMRLVDILLRHCISWYFALKGAFRSAQTTGMVNGVPWSDVDATTDQGVVRLANFKAAVDQMILAIEAEYRKAVHSIDKAPQTNEEFYAGCLMLGKASSFSPSAQVVLTCFAEFFTLKAEHPAYQHLKDLVTDIEGQALTFPLPNKQTLASPLPVKTPQTRYELLQTLLQNNNESLRRVETGAAALTAISTIVLQSVVQAFAWPLHDGALSWLAILLACVGIFFSLFSYATFIWAYALKGKHAKKSFQQKSAAGETTSSVSKPKQSPAPGTRDAAFDIRTQAEFSTPDELIEALDTRLEPSEYRLPSRVESITAEAVLSAARLHQGRKQTQLKFGRMFALSLICYALGLLLYAIEPTAPDPGASAPIVSAAISGIPTTVPADTPVLHTTLIETPPPLWSKPPIESTQPVAFFMPLAAPR